MKIKYSPNDFLYLSARIKAMEKSLLSREDLSVLKDAPTLTELFRLLSERGISVKTEGTGEKSLEGAFTALLDTAYLDILTNTPSPELFTVFTYAYDCINLKTAIKYAEKGERTKLSRYGTVSPEAVWDATDKRSFNAFPTNMAIAADEAIGTYAKTRRPEEIDLSLDQALYLDLKASVEGNPIDFFHTWLKIKADTVNILTLLRIMRASADASLLRRAFVPGGEIPLSELLSVLHDLDGAHREYPATSETDFKALTELLSVGRYEGLCHAIRGIKTDISEVERISREILLSLIKEARSVLSGAEVVAGYVAAIEEEIKNLRIIVAGKGSAKNSQRVLEMVCEGYV